MAKNWKPVEAVEAIRNGSKEDKIDIGRRFPLFSMLAAQLNEAGSELLSALPDYVTVRKMESSLKGTDEETETETDVEEEIEEVEEKPKAKRTRKATKKVEPEADEDEEDEEDEGPSAKELFAQCKKLGIKVAPKLSVEEYQAAIKKHKDEEAKKVKEARTKKLPKEKAPEPEVEDDDEDWDI